LGISRSFCSIEVSHIKNTLYGKIYCSQNKSDCGDDYLTKPFGTEVLLLKIEAILGRRSFKVAREEKISIGNFEYFPTK
jgi:hypothetical protein